MLKHHRVALVFDPNASTLLSTLADRCHVWLVDSNENQKAAQACWQRAEPLDDELAAGVTTFTRKAQKPHEALEALLDLVEDHHGELAHDPPVHELLIVGLDPSEAVLAVLKEWGYDRFDTHPEGFLAKREPNPR